jgi:predicted O-linked N-acetylglucosamine transferase (SPINDLY family)
VQRASALFRDLRGLSDEDAARQIAADRIDVLIDLKGYTENMRLGIVAFRPAPVVVSWLGWPGTVGHQRLADYIIGDPTVTPPDVAADYSEALAIMPHCYQSNDRSRTVGPRPTRTEAGLPEEGFVFCSFNQMWKIGPETFSVWCRLLDAVPGSVLWLLDTRDNAGANLRQEAQRRGVDPGRVIFAPTLPYSGHLGRLQLADLVLDVFPYGSHTTASDALWCGVPVVTKIGEIFASRVSASLLNAAGLPELVTTSDNDYFTLALRLAMQPGEIGCLRDRIVATRMSVPLFDTVRFTRDLERLYDEIWKQAMRGKREPITLEPRAGR